MAALTTDSQYMVQLFSNDFIIQHIKSKNMIGKGEKLEGLYVLNSLSLGHDCALEQFSVPSSICINTITAQIWHNRLGHPSYQKLDVLIIKPHLDHLKSHYTDTCYVCPLAK